jgi:hypothetical protein
MGDPAFQIRRRIKRPATIEFILDIARRLVDAHRKSLFKIARVGSKRGFSWVDWLCENLSRRYKMRSAGAVQIERKAYALGIFLKTRLFEQPVFEKNNMLNILLKTLVNRTHQTHSKTRFEMQSGMQSKLSQLT